MINEYGDGTLCAIHIPLEALARMFTPHTPVACIDGLPEGAILIGVGKGDPPVRGLVLVFEHPSLPTTALGQPLAVINPVYQAAPFTPIDREILLFDKGPQA